MKMHETYPKNCVECPRFNNCDSAYGEEGCGFKIFIEGNKELLAAKNKKKNKKQLTFSFCCVIIML